MQNLAAEFLLGGKWFLAQQRDQPLACEMIAARLGLGGLKELQDIGMSLSESCRELVAGR